LTSIDHYCTYGIQANIKFLTPEEGMNRNIGFIIFLFFLLSIPLLGQTRLMAQPDNKPYQEINKGDWKIWGCFEKACSVAPEQMDLFGISSKYIKIVYRYMGQTGDNTFDIMKVTHNTSDNTSKTEHATYHINSGVNELVYMLYTNPFWNQGCPDSGGKIYLKMLGIKGNILQFQIIIPECWKQYLAPDNDNKSYN
jgi:hypothetical protein